LWDEGFSLLVVCQWDIALCCEIIESWFDTIDEKGWIAPEQARSPEVTRNIPSEFLAVDYQSDSPPSLIMPL
jgi:mannosyl-oligosaccharide glucosidase